MKCFCNNAVAFFVAIIGLICLASCSSEELKVEPQQEFKTPKLLSFCLPTNKNALNIIEDVRGEIIGDSIVECWIPYIISDKHFIAEIDAEGEVLVEDLPASDEPIDFSRPVSITVNSHNVSKKYTVYVHIFTGLPIMWIETENRADITSREEYLNAHMRLCEGVITRSAGDVVEADLQIKGRGNSTWIDSPKKPYRLKFYEKIPLLGEHEDKSWVLLANYFDKTMLRNAIAFYISSISNLDWTPSSHFVELMLNGRYHGTYQLTEKIKVSKHRVNIGDDGFLLEMDNNLKTGEIAFTTQLLPNPVRIHEPKVTEGDDNYNYIKDYVNKVEKALYSDMFLDDKYGYKNFIDIESVVEWYIINEITENSTCRGDWYMNLQRGGKLKMGPIWDFDMAFSNSLWVNPSMNPYYLFVKDAKWISRMFEDPEFVRMVKERFKYFYERRDQIFNFIDSNAHYLKSAAAENNNRWNTLYYNIRPEAPKELNIWGSYYSEVSWLKEWLFIRLEWLKVQFDEM